MQLFILSLLKCFAIFFSESPVLEELRKQRVLVITRTVTFSSGSHILGFYVMNFVLSHDLRSHPSF